METEAQEVATTCPKAHHQLGVMVWNWNQGRSVIGWVLNLQALLHRGSALCIPTSPPPSTEAETPLVTLSAVSLQTLSPRSAAAAAASPLT